MVFEDDGFAAPPRLAMKRADPAQTGREVDMDLDISHGRYSVSV
jgi:hypothetical protein